MTSLETLGRALQLIQSDVSVVPEVSEKDGLGSSAGVRRHDAHQTPASLTVHANQHVAVVILKHRTQSNGTTLHQHVTVVKLIEE